MGDKAKQANARSPGAKLALGALRFFCFAGAGASIFLFGSWALAFICASIWILADIALPRLVRLLVGIPAVLWLMLFFGFVAGSNFLGYRVAHGLVYRVEEKQSVRGVEIDCLLGASGGTEATVLPDVRYDFYEGPYNVQIALRDSQRTADRARITNAVAEGEHGRLELDLRDDISWFEKGGVHEDGWVPFQREWSNASGHVAKVDPARCMIGSVENADLQALGDKVALRFTLHLDIRGEVTRHEITLDLEQKHVTSSGFTISSP